MIKIDNDVVELTGCDKLLGYEAVAVFMTIYERVGTIEQLTMVKMLMDLMEEQQT